MFRPNYKNSVFITWLFYQNFLFQIQDSGPGLRIDQIITATFWDILNRDKRLCWADNQVCDDTKLNRSCPSLFP